MINDLLTAEVAPRRVEYRVRHFGGVFIFGLIPKISISILVALLKNPGGTAKIIDFE